MFLDCKNFNLCCRLIVWSISLNFLMGSSRVLVQGAPSPINDIAGIRKLKGKSGKYQTRQGNKEKQVTLAKKDNKVT